MKKRAPRAVPGQRPQGIAAAAQVPAAVSSRDAGQLPSCQFWDRNTAPPLLRRVLKAYAWIDTTVSFPHVRITVPLAMSCSGTHPSSRVGQLIATSTRSPTAIGFAALNRKAELLRSTVWLLPAIITRGSSGKQYDMSKTSGYRRFMRRSEHAVVSRPTLRRFRTTIFK